MPERLSVLNRSLDCAQFGEAVTPEMIYESAVTERAYNASGGGGEEIVSVLNE